MWFNFKVLLQRLVRFLELTMYLVVLLLPVARLLNLYYGFMDPLYFIVILYGFCMIIVLIIGSSHLSIIYYFAFYLFFFTEKFWCASYNFLIKYYWFNFVSNLVIICIFYSFVHPKLLFLYIFYYILFVFFNFLFFKIYFSMEVVQQENFSEVFFDPLVIRDAYFNLHVKSGFHYFFFCHRFNVDIGWFNHKLTILKGKVDKRCAFFLVDFKSLGTDDFRLEMPYKNYKWLLISSSLSASFGLLFIRFFIWF